MRSAYSVLTMLLAVAALLGLLAVSQLAGQQDEAGEETAVNLADELAAVRNAVGEQDFESVWQHCHRIVEAVNARDPEARAGPEHFAVGMAHYYLVAEGFDKALAAGGLPDEDAQFAQSMRDYIKARPPDIHVVGFGQQVDLAEYVAEGKTTIVDFFSEYCRPCLRISPLLAELAVNNSELRVVKVDINRPGVQGIDWGSPVAQQFKLRSVPSFLIFGPDRQLIAQGDQAYETVIQWVGQ